jgi:hypothetical protein
MRPRFLDQPYWSTRTPRTDESLVDYASPLSHQPSYQSWLAADIAVLVIAVVVVAGLLLGVVG